MSKKELEKRYGITIVENGFFKWTGRYIRLYDIYSADGCCWEKGLPTLKDVQKECKEWKEHLLKIKNGCANITA